MIETVTVTLHPLEAARLQSGCKVLQLCKAAHIHTERYCEFIDGNNKALRLNELDKICQTLGVPTGWVIDQILK